MKKIIVENGDRLKLMKIFNTTYPTVRSALNFQTNSELACKIRKAALNRGGVILEKSTH
jgi:hypothetical protein